MGVFDGVKVLDFTHAYAGPFCTQILGDFGADVIKVERVDGGDQSRTWAPFNNDYSGYYASFNRGKKSLSVNIKSPEGQEILKNLIKESDIVCSNFKYGTLERYGLGYEEMKKMRPDIIYVTNSGFGSKGEFSKFAAYDNVIQAVSGVMDVNGFEIPAKIGPAIGDSYSGLLMLLGLSIAWYHKLETGVGQEVNVSMLGALIGLLDYPVLEYAANGKVMTRGGNRGLYYAPEDAYLTADGEYLAITIRNDEQWETCRKVLGIDDDRFPTNEERLKNVDTITEIMADKFKGLTAKVAEEMFKGTGIAAAKVASMDEAARNEHLIARNMVIDNIDPVYGDMKLVGDPIKLSANEQILDIPSPTLGQHTDEILNSLGLSDEKISELKGQGIV